MEEGEGQVDVCDAGRTVASIWALPSGGFFAVGEAGQIDGTTDAGDFVVAVIEEGEGTVVTRPDFLWSSRHDPTLVPGALRPRRATALYPSNTSSIDAAASARTVH